MERDANMGDEETRKVAVFCAGNIAERLLIFPFRDGVQMVAVVDNSGGRIGKSIRGFLIESPEVLKERQPDCVIIATTSYEIIVEVSDYLESIGINKNHIITSEGVFTLGYQQSRLDEIFKIEKKTLVPFKKGKPDSLSVEEQFIGKLTETQKAHDRREREGFFEKYCRGEGLDIGFGVETVVPGCSGWDLQNGDAQYMDGVPDESFDFVYSSHCLEHMKDVRVTLKNWFRLVKTGGYLIIAIPHRDLYEKKKSLPSRWNIDHKHMFLIGRSEEPDTLDIVDEIKESLSNYDICYVKACDDGHTITDPLEHSDGEYQIEIVIRKTA